jgi:hypothetical protein
MGNNKKKRRRKDLLRKEALQREHRIAALLGGAPQELEPALQSKPKQELKLGPGRAALGVSMGAAQEWPDGAPPVTKPPWFDLEAMWAPTNASQSPTRFAEPPPLGSPLEGPSERAESKPAAGKARSGDSDSSTTSGGEDGQLRLRLPGGGAVASARKRMDASARRARRRRNPKTVASSPPAPAGLVAFPAGLPPLLAASASGECDYSFCGSGSWSLVDGA